MATTKQPIAIILLVYFLFGLFHLVQFKSFILPTPYSNFVVFALTLTLFFSKTNKADIPAFLLGGFAVLDVLIHPFLWEIILSAQEQNHLNNSFLFSILSVFRPICLTLFFGKLCLEKTHRILWCVPLLLSIGGFWYYESIYLSIIFLSSGLCAFYFILSKRDSSILRMKVLLAIGFIHAINLIYWLIF